MTGSWRPSCPLAALEARAALLAGIRQFFSDRGVLEVQTPVLGSHAVTDVHVAAIEVDGYGYLQTSPEYQLKRLLAAGAPSLYQLGPAFRAGERGRLHNPEFTLLEWYRLGFDDEALMREVAELVDLALGPGAYRTLGYAELVGNLDRSPDALDLALTEALAGLGEGRYFITRYPAEQAALARLAADDPTVAARFELVVDGVELG